jgi:hypothetical protein
LDKAHVSTACKRAVLTSFFLLDGSSLDLRSPSHDIYFSVFPGARATVLSWRHDEIEEAFV